MKKTEFRSKTIYGDFYENPGKPLAVLIGGSRAGIPKVNQAFLESLVKNHNVLVLAYFGVPGLAQQLDRVPLEYFSGAILQICESYGCDKEGIILIGSSKGGEAVLLLCSKLLRPRAAVACVASRFAWQAIPYGISSFLFPRSSWTFEGREVSYVRFGYSLKIFGELRRHIYIGCHEKGISGRKDDTAVIDLSSFGGKLLLLSSSKDPYWPSMRMSAEIMASGVKGATHRVLECEGHYFLEYPESTKVIVEFLDNLQSEETLR